MNLIRMRERGLQYPALRRRVLAAEAKTMIEPYTGLPNRAYFTDALGRAMSEVSRRKDLTIAVVVFDVDGFKEEINDVYGHPVGDRVLMAVADSMRSSIRSYDVPARLGGDEFGLLLQGRSKEELQDILSEQRHNHIGGETLSIMDKLNMGLYEATKDLNWSGVPDRELGILTHLSMGVSFFSGEIGMTLDKLMANADKAMYDNKRMRGMGRGSRMR